MQIIGHEFYPSQRERVSISNKKEIQYLEQLGFKKIRTNKDDTITMKRRCRLMVKLRFNDESDGHWLDMYDEITEKYGGKTEKEIKENFFTFIKHYYTPFVRGRAVINGNIRRVVVEHKESRPDNFYEENKIEGALRIVGHEYIPPKFERVKKSETSKIAYLKKEGYIVSSKEYKDGSICLYKPCKLLLKVELYEDGPGHWYDINGWYIPSDNYFHLSMFMREYYRHSKVVVLTSEGNLKVDYVSLIILRKTGKI